MAEIFGLKELQERKRALVAESELYRQTLRLEVQNIRLYHVRMQRKLGWVSFVNPLLMLAGSFLGSRFLGRRLSLRRRGRWSLLGVSLLVWRVYRHYGPLLQGLASRFFGSRGGGPRPEPAPPAARG